MDRLAAIGNVSSNDLAPTRDIAHRAIQHMTKAARANLDARSDDGHSNLGWDETFGALLSQPLPGPGGAVHIGLIVEGLDLIVVSDDSITSSLSLPGKTDRSAADWLDDQLENYGLAPSSGVSLPYDLPDRAAAIEAYPSSGPADAGLALAGWFSLAHALLSEFARRHDDLNPGPGPVRCWPHHFDIATYVGLEAGEFEIARGVGVGLSPGDETYGEPYFYINPWPHLNTDDLPSAPAPGHWHTAGFVGIIATGEKILELDDIGSRLPDFIEESFLLGRKLLGI